MSDTQTLEGIKAAAPEGATHYHISLQVYLNRFASGWFFRKYNGYWEKTEFTDGKVDLDVELGDIIVLANIPADDMAKSIPFEPLEGDQDEINHPKHYQIGAGLQAIDIIKGAMTPEQYKGYLLGNQIKYRMRAGSKGDAAKCIAKADWYRDRLNQEFPC